MPQGALSGNLRRYTVNNRLYRWHIAQFLEQLATLVAQTQPKTLLDVGCGEGFVAAFLKQRLPEVEITGIDASVSALAYAQAHFGQYATFRRGDIYGLPFPDRAFDTVVCSEVLEHLEDPESAIAELKRVARRYVVLTVPLEPYFRWLNRLGQWLRVSEDPGHVQFWTHAAFKRLVQQHFNEAKLYRKHIYQLACGYVDAAT
ncbi:putative methyltransferase YcgJ [bacterium HR18]|jgi:ubiquinone/menaquinone biosynthesis C-methylase UbiE|uniref:Class I SAM-dependent methyltransferase n=1 Tax=Rhodothermus marinus TaxID=29549 RepID=A0A7V2B096_RHOMR|nr:putative methyltransferase YcgJ [bacterium HR18]